MTVKQYIVEQLEAHKGEYVSGEELAAGMGVSRAAIWKTVQSLQEEGYEIHSMPRRGYCLAVDSDILSREGILPFLDDKWKEIPIWVHDRLDSTNQEAKRLAAEGAPHGTVIIARSQTAGRGRLGRQFASPQVGGLYMSILLRPRMTASMAVDVTTLAAVSVCRAIENRTRKEPKIKWVNDIFLDGKKVCGILTEAVSDVETGMIDSLVLGIGVNVTTPPEAFPEEVRKVAGSLFGPGEQKISKNELTGEILNEVLGHVDTLGSHQHMEEYRRRCFILGKSVRFHKEEQVYTGIAKEILEDGALLVTLDKGGEIRLQSGEVSVRPD